MPMRALTSTGLVSPQKPVASGSSMRFHAESASAREYLPCKWRKSLGAFNPLCDCEAAARNMASHRVYAQAEKHGSPVDKLRAIATRGHGHASA
eukprot:scaffold1248_cov122-Isochrysis_galbana.AAC.1